MDLLIKDLELPKSCYTCQFGDNYEGSFCLATNDEHQIDHMTAIRRRPKWCPLVEVKPHGDLIDRLKLATTVADLQQSLIGKEYDPFLILGDVLRLIDLSPVVLEASE